MTIYSFKLHWYKYTQYNISIYIHVKYILMWARGILSRQTLPMSQLYSRNTRYQLIPGGCRRGPIFRSNVSANWRIALLSFRTDKDIGMTRCACLTNFCDNMIRLCNAKHLFAVPKICNFVEMICPWYSLLTHHMRNLWRINAHLTSYSYSRQLLCFPVFNEPCREWHW